MKPNLFLMVFLLIFIAGCASQMQIYNISMVGSSLEKRIKGEYEQVFRAAQISLADYPIEINDMESGLLQTAFIKNQQMWKPPHLKRGWPPGHRYIISIQMLRIEKNEKTTQLIITKRIEYKKDFFAAYKPVKTDGLEEIALLYRIQRELWLENQLQ